MTRTALDLRHLPSPTEETWKYTNLPRAVPEGLGSALPEERMIHIPRGKVCAEPVEILWTGVENQHQQPVFKIILEAGAQVTVIERHEGQGAYWKNMVTEIRLGDGAVLNHVRLQADSLQAVHTNMSTVTLGRDSVYEGFSCNSGAKLSRHEISATLAGENGRCTFAGVNLLRDVQHGDTTITLAHTAPHGFSEQFYRTILEGMARGVFQGKVHVHRSAQKTDAYQLSKALLLSDGCEMDTKPELEIYADDVKCAHGATTGQMDETALFYLRSRGVPVPEARRLLIRAFVDEAVDKIGDGFLRHTVHERVMQWLRNAHTP